MFVYLGLCLLETLYHALQLDVTLLDFGDVIESDEHALRLALGAQDRRRIDCELDGVTIFRLQVELRTNTRLARVEHIEPG